VRFTSVAVASDLVQKQQQLCSPNALAHRTYTIKVTFRTDARLSCSLCLCCCCSCICPLAVTQCHRTHVLQRDWQPDRVMEQQTRSIAARCPASSHLLTALAQCNDAVWQQHLLPRLWEDASISSVALSCKQLRALCQSNVYRLHLDTHSTLQLPEQQQHGAELAARFPNCQEVSYTADDEECLGHLVELLPGLARWVQCMMWPFDSAIERGYQHRDFTQLLCIAAAIRPHFLHVVSLLQMVPP
jgi:hypothetical protein